MICPYAFTLHTSMLGTLGKQKENKNSQINKKNKEVCQYIPKCCTQHLVLQLAYKKNNYNPKYGFYAWVTSC